LVYEKENYEREFVGKDNDGNDLPAATYYYVLKINGNGRKKIIPGLGFPN